MLSLLSAKSVGEKRCTELTGSAFIDIKVDLRFSLLCWWIFQLDVF
jgi:hypothetical protein